MRPINTPTTSTAGFFQWNSPLPYFFGGLFLIFGVIAVALFFLACCHNKSLESPGDEKEEMSTKTMQLPVDWEPKIVVIMAGDDLPTHIAKPSLASTWWVDPNSTIFRSHFFFLLEGDQDFYISFFRYNWNIQFITLLQLVSLCFELPSFYLFIFRWIIPISLLLFDVNTN